MAFESFITDCVAHTDAGIAISLLNFITCKMTTPAPKRIAQKQDVLQAMEILLDTEAADQTVLSTDGTNCRNHQRDC